MSAILVKVRWWSGLKIAINWPPDESFLSSIMYEGLLFIKSVSLGGDLTELKKQLLSRVQVEDKGQQGAQRTLENSNAPAGKAENSSEPASGQKASQKASVMRLRLIGDDLRSNAVKYLEERLKEGYGIELKYVSDLIYLVDGLRVEDMDLYKRLEGNSYLIGLKDFVENPKDPEFPFQIVKPDRYQGFSVLEKSLFKREITTKLDLAALVMFLSGLVSSYVTNVDNDHYFLLFGNSMIPEAQRNPEIFMSVKGKFKDDLRDDIWRVRNNEELIALSMLLSTAGVKSARENELSRLSFRVLRVVDEGRVYKVYNGIPLDFLIQGGPYSDLKQLEKLQRLSKGLMSSASAFLARRGNMEEGRHAYLALKELALFLTTGEQSHRYSMLREMYAAEKVASKEGAGDKYGRMIYRSLASNRLDDDRIKMQLKDAYQAVKDYLLTRSASEAQSNLSIGTEMDAQTTGVKPSGSAYSGFQPRPFLDCAIEELDDQRMALVQAPTGYGKTSITMALSLEQARDGYKLIATYPLRSLVEEQESVLGSMLESMGMKNLVGSRYMGVATSPYFVKPVTLTTVDSLALTSLGFAPEELERVLRTREPRRSWETHGTYEYGSAGHYLFSWGAVYLSKILMDEVHLLYDSDKSSTFLVAFLKLAKQFETPVVMMSATVPRSFSDYLSNKFPNLKFISFKPDMDPAFYRERKNKKYQLKVKPVKSKDKFEDLRKLLGEAAFRRALVVFDTVDDAVSFYRMLGDGVNKLLIHSRFTPSDRRHKALLAKQMESGIIVGTQAIEAGMDFSSDLIISELAPASSLVQRFGRFLRRSETKGSSYIWYEADELRDDRYKVYDGALIKRTLDYIQSNPDLNLHVDYLPLLDRVYPEGIYSSNERTVEGMIAAIFHLESPAQNVIDLLYENDGSLVREGSLLTAVNPQGFEVPVSYDFLRKNCVHAFRERDDDQKPCPRNEKEAAILALKGYKFAVSSPYDADVGLQSGAFGR